MDSPKPSKRKAKLLKEEISSEKTSLGKRQPQMREGSESPEIYPYIRSGYMTPEKKPEMREGSESLERMAPKKRRESPSPRRPTTREQPMKAWIREHKAFIENGGAPDRYKWAREKTDKRTDMDDPNSYWDWMIRYGKLWDRVFGENFDPDFAERYLRPRGTRLLPWQKIKDYREDHRIPHRDLNWQQYQALLDENDKNAKARKASRARLSTSTKKNKLKKRRLREQEAYRNKKEAQGGKVREKRSPKSQAAYRKQQKAEWAKENRRKLKPTRSSHSAAKRSSLKEVEPSEVCETDRGSMD